MSNSNRKICARGALRLLTLMLMLGSMRLLAAAQVSQSTPAGNPGPPAPPAAQTGTPPARPAASGSPISSSIAGSVVDTNGAVVPGAQVQLIGPNGDIKQTVAADAWGRFVFSGLPAGTFKISVTSLGLTTFTSDAIALTAGQNIELPQTVLRVGGIHADVNVVANLQDVAQAQVEAQEKQRVFGVIPNFYSSYIWNAAPMTPKQKFGLALRSSIDPVSFLVAGGIAGVEQWHNTFPGYGSGAEGYFKRFGASYADYTIDTMISDAVLPSLFKQDPRYFYLGSGSTKSRAWYAISQTFVTRADDGHSEVNWSHLLGSFATAGISNVYHAPQDRTASITVRNGLIIIGGSAVTNLIREFLLRKITSKVPDYAQGKP